MDKPTQDNGREITYKLAGIAKKWEKVKQVVKARKEVDVEGILKREGDIGLAKASTMSGDKKLQKALARKAEKKGGMLATKVDYDPAEYADKDCRKCRATGRFKRFYRKHSKYVSAICKCAFRNRVAFLRKQNGELQ